MSRLLGRLALWWLTFAVGLALGAAAGRADVPHPTGYANCSGILAQRVYAGECRLLSDGSVRLPISTRAP